MKVTFLTIGQSPRTDVIPEMIHWLGPSTKIEERGVLDNLTDEEIETLKPDTQDASLVSRLKDGREVILGKSKLQPRLQSLIEDIDAKEIGCIVLLCTGQFKSLSSRGLLLKAQEIVDSGIEAIAKNASTVGIMMPLESQIGKLNYQPNENQVLLTSFASPYSTDRLEIASQELASADLTVMHCMGYSEAMRATVTRISGRPVMLARRLVACAVAQLL